MSSRPPTPAGERPRPRKHAVIVYFGGRDVLTNLCRSLFWTEANIKAGGGGGEGGGGYIALAVFFRETYFKTGSQKFMFAKPTPCSPSRVVILYDQ